MRPLSGEEYLDALDVWEMSGDGRATSNFEAIEADLIGPGG
jgi:hypothetical protein